MAIGFMSFGGMLTGGEEAPKKVLVQNEELENDNDLSLIHISEPTRPY